MIHAPPKRPTEWWRRREWRKYAEDLFKYYAHRRNYTLTLDPDAKLIAAVDPVSKLVIVNPNLPTPRPGTGLEVRETPSPDQRTATLLKALLAHEAAHVRYSCEKPAGLLGQIWNALEDERIERLISQDHPDLEAAFTHLGDTLLTNREQDNPPTALEGCLLWRWLHDRGAGEWSCSEPQAWELVRPLVEAAWEAGSSEEVVSLSRRILDLLGVPQDTPATDDDLLSEPSATGGGQSGEGDEGDESSDAPEAPGGAGGEGRGGGEPEAPVDPGTSSYRRAESILAEVEGQARALAGALLPPPEKRLPVSSRSRGRFDYGRSYQGSERPFQYRARSAPRSVEVRLLHDLSGSMGSAEAYGSNQFVSIRAAMMLHRACELAGVPFTHHGFMHGDPIPITDPSVNAEAGRQAIAGLRSSGGTYLAPSLEMSARECRDNTILFVLCDGWLDDNDAMACSRIVKRMKGQVVPLLIGGATEALPTFKRIFGQAQPISNVADLPRVVRTYLEAVAPVTS